MRQGGGEQIMAFRGINFTKNPYCVFPLYYSYMTGVSSPDFPLFNSMMEMYLKEGFSASMMQSFRGGMTDSETANMALRDHSLTEILGDWDNTVSSALVKQAGSFIFLALKNRVGLREFDWVREMGFHTAVTGRPGNIHRQHRYHLTALPRFYIGQYTSGKEMKNFVSGLTPCLTGIRKRVVTD